MERREVERRKGVSSGIMERREEGVGLEWNLGRKGGRKGWG